ncbi:1212_t:CDS:2 [Cetraspora pellucida]|uniref:1212_t:CDS:1 n=1 Tax=Cetraspora pellucida TaxID=1433469 RepID=A0A9N9BL19_9GLOM|nr:1212_t:CDS:2 [Cetraspora pellucida]
MVSEFNNNDVQYFCYNVHILNFGVEEKIKKPKPKYNNRHSKPTRGGGRKFTNPRRLAIEKDEEDGLWEHREAHNDIESSDDEEEREVVVKKSKETKESKESKSESLESTAEKEAAKQRYWKLHLEGKTEQAKADLAPKAEAQKAKLEKEGRKSRNKSKVN